MNDVLKNIFDNDSMAAIKNAEQVVPAQRTARRVGNIVANDKIEEPEYEETGEVEYMDTKEIKELKQQLDSQAGIINKLINSQNELIKELNDLKSRPPEKVVVEKVAEPSQKPPEQPKQEQPKEKEKQQNAMCNGLNPEDFAVEKTFYFGNK